MVPSPSAPLRTATRRPTGARSARGFTIVELLVVVGILATLIAILLPAISSARVTAARTDEMAGARDLMLAWHMYADDHDDRVLPGYASGMEAYDLDGRSLEEGADAILARRYPFRIIPYLGREFRGLYRMRQREQLEELEQFDRDLFNYLVSLAPSLGINATWVGGDENELGFDPQFTGLFGSFVTTRRSQVFHPDRLLVFASARGPDELSGVGTIEGHFRVRSPRLLAVSGSRWPETWQAGDPPVEHGFVSRRYHDKAVTAFIDGHVSVMDEEPLRDMRHWANGATTADFGLEPVD